MCTFLMFNTLCHIDFVLYLFTNDIFSLSFLGSCYEKKPSEHVDNQFMINLIRRAILGKIPFAKKDFRYSQVIKVQIHTTEQTMNKMPDPEVKRKSSPGQNHFQKSKHRKKNEKQNTDKLANANEKKPYTWFLAIPSKYSSIHYF